MHHDFEEKNDVILIFVYNKGVKIIYFKDQYLYYLF
jgi:hypothetical protein